MTKPLPVAGLVPQTGTMCLLDQVVSYDLEHIVCSATAHRCPGHPFFTRNGRIRSVIALEYAAQAAAAHGSLLTSKSAQPVRAGFLASARSFRLGVDWLDDLAGDLVVQADRLLDSGDSVIYSFSVTAGSIFVADGRLSVFFKIPSPRF